MSTNQASRPRFYEGQYLGADDLTTVVDYGRITDARHLLGAHTWGIAAGLQLTEQDSPAGGGQVDVRIQPGYAWDGFGRPIVVLFPTKIPAELFKAIVFDNGLDAGDPLGRLFKVWLRYDESATQQTRPGFGSCGVDQFARIGETFRIEIGEFPGHDSHAPISVAGYSIDAQETLQKFDPQTPPVPLSDESVPYQDFPNDKPTTRWLIPLGEVRWQPNSTANQPGKFIKRKPADLTHSDSLRRHIGVVAGAVEAAGSVVRIHKRTTPYSLVSSTELLQVEGHLRVDGDAHLFNGKLDFKDVNGSDGGVPLSIQRAVVTAVGVVNTRLETVIGKDNHGFNSFAVGPLDGTGKFVAKLTVRDDDKVGVGTETPNQAVSVQGSGSTFLNVKANNGTQEILIGADAAGGIVSTMTNHDLVLRSGVNQDRMVIKADGKIGIGTATPAGGLSVARPTQGTLTLFSATADFEYDGGGDGLFVFRDTGGKTAFLGGNVGIGTDAPAHRLDVANRMRVRQGADASAGIWFAQGALNTNRGFVGMASDNHIGFWGDGGARWGLVMDVNNANVGIGTETPALKLDVKGDIGRDDGPETIHLWAARIGDVGGGVLFLRAVNNGVVAFDGSNNRVGIGLNNPRAQFEMTGDMFLGGNVFYRGGFFFASDERLKKEIEPLTDALDVLLKLRGRRFLWAEADQSGAPSTAQMGLVAQEVENVFPEWVREDPYGNKSVSLKGFEALAIEALREMKQEIDDIKARLDKLKG